MTIAAILRQKGQRIVSVAPEDDVAAVAATLTGHRIGAVLVQDSTGDVRGILSERDIVRAVASHGPAALQRAASDIMTRVMHTVTPATTVAAALGMMTDRRVRHLPVLDEDGRLAGMVSIGDLVKARIEAAELETESLRAYVVSGA